MLSQSEVRFFSSDRDIKHRDPFWQNSTPRAQIARDSPNPNTVKAPDKFLSDNLGILPLFFELRFLGSVIGH